MGCRQAVRHQTLTLTFVGSNPAIPAKFIHIIMYDPLAQSAEQLPFKQWVRSSNLRRVTRKALASAGAFSAKRYISPSEGGFPINWYFSLRFKFPVIANQSADSSALRAAFGGCALDAPAGAVVWQSSSPMEPGIDYHQKSRRPHFSGAFRYIFPLSRGISTPLKRTGSQTANIRQTPICRADE